MPIIKPAAVKKPRKEPFGRPSIYTLELAERICELVATSTEGTTKLCETHDWLPNEITIRQWRFKKPDFATMYLNAKRAQSELLAEKINELENDVHYYVDAQGNKRIDAPSVALATARANNTKWIAARLANKIYGDTKQTEPQNAGETLSKIQEMVNDFNKTNASDV